jgi:hypothetical protein
MPNKFIATFDLHFGFERKGGHKVPLHDMKAWNVVMEFAKDFKPDTWIHGGDMLDCGVISHHNKSKPGNVEGLRLLADAEEGYDTFIKPIQAKNKVYMIGNHEDWLNDLIIETPALEGIIDIKKLLSLDDWKLVDQGGVYNLGKLSFLHGDTVKGGEHVAKAAVINYERNVRFGHHHTAQLYTKTSPIEYKNAKTGMAVGCLCTKSPKYGESKPNRWTQGFLFGYVGEGMFNDYMAVIVDGRAFINGKLYKG